MKCTSTWCTAVATAVTAAVTALQILLLLVLLVLLTVMLALALLLQQYREEEHCHQYSMCTLQRCQACGTGQSQSAVLVRHSV
jgi:heme/copper-type cytochrome/quinol oxidase subunit 2